MPSSTYVTSADYYSCIHIFRQIKLAVSGGGGQTKIKHGVCKTSAGPPRMTLRRFTNCDDGASLEYLVREERTAFSGDCVNGIVLCAHQTLAVQSLRQESQLRIAGKV